MTTNENSTRFFSQKQEDNVAKALGGYRVPASGSGKWQKSDVVVKDASLSVECKTVVAPKKSFSIKKDWIEKHKQEAFSNNLDNTALAISFEPEGNENYYVISEKLMKFLVEKLSEDKFIV